MPRHPSLQVAIDARITDPCQGLGNATLALANALSSSPTREQQYTFIVREDTSDWIKPHIFGPCRLATVAETRGESGLRALKSTRFLNPLRSTWRAAKAAVYTPKSHGFLESQGFDLVHFPTQMAYLTNLPSIYQPWDLQHLHYPEFLSKSDAKSRQRLYPIFCRQAKYVCVQTNWGKQDLIEKLRVPAEKIAVIRWGSVLDFSGEPSPDIVSATIQKYAIPSQFFFYPALTWVHKNHACIIRALDILKREHGLRIDVYFSGQCSEYRDHLDSIAQSLKVSGQVHFLGFIPADELQVLFASATAMVFPSKFEGLGMPILEAFRSRLPVLSSNASVLPEVAQDGALYFDPNSPKELAERMRQILEDAGLRRNLVEKGLRVLSRCSMRDTAANLQALYEKTASGADISPRSANLKCLAQQ